MTNEQTDWRALSAELLLFAEQAGEIAHNEGLWPKCDQGPGWLLDRARAALAQPEPEDDEIDEEAATVIPWLLEEAAQAADAGQPYAAGKLTLAAQLLGERRPTIKPVPVAERLPGCAHERFEFSVFDSEYEEQAGGTAPTYAQALSEGQHYLAMYSQDGPHSLELRRVEVLIPDALPVPGAEANHG